jgi:GT2 family glycosyltransferase
VPAAKALSVVVPVRDSAATLGRVLTAIRQSALKRENYELIVVDDSSNDASAIIAARYADTVIRLTGPGCGPAYARNRGIEIARGEIVAFVNPDVVVSPDTLPTMLSTLATRVDIGAVAASRDETSGAQNFASQYWNLLVGFGEQRHPEICAHFESGCGAVRRGALIAAGMYDEWRFGRECLEGLELGQRLQRAGYRLLLMRDLRVVYLKHWSVAKICREVWQRSALLSRSFGYQSTSVSVPGEVVITLSRALTPAVAVMGSASLAAAFVPPSFGLIRDACVLALILLGNLPVHRFYARQKGLAFAIASAPLHVIIQGVAAVALCVGWLLRDTIGDRLPDATTQAFSEVGLEIWPPVPRRI